MNAHPFHKAGLLFYNRDTLGLRNRWIPWVFHCYRQHKIPQKCPLCVPSGKLFSWHAVKRRVGAEHGPGRSLGVGFTGENHRHRGAEATKGKQTWPLFSQGPLAGIAPHNANTVYVDRVFVCVYSLPASRRRTHLSFFYLYFLVPDDSHSLFLKGPTGSARLS